MFSLIGIRRRGRRLGLSSHTSLFHHTTFGGHTADYGLRCGFILQLYILIVLTIKRFGYEFEDYGAQAVLLACSDGGCSEAQPERVVG